MNIIQFNSQCTALQNNPFLPFIIILVVFVLIAPLIAHLTSGRKHVHRVCSISECLREDLSKPFVGFAVTGIITCYGILCQSDWVLPFLSSLVCFLLLLISFINPWPDEQNWVFVKVHYSFAFILFTLMLVASSLLVGYHFSVLLPLSVTILIFQVFILFGLVITLVMGVRGKEKKGEQPAGWSGWNDMSSFMEWLYVILFLFSLSLSKPAVIVDYWS